MKRLLVLVLLSSVALLCSAAPALEPVTCTEGVVAVAARLAMHDINEHHRHGYKFRLDKVQGSKVEKVDEGCNIEMQVDLLETTCHIVNPRHFEDCPLREEHARAVMANCSILMTVENGDANVTKYECDTRQVKTNAEMVSICPDCPMLIPLNSTEGLKSVKEALKKFNENTTNQHYYVLIEVGRIRTGHVMTTGMNYYAEFALVESQCPMGSRIIPEACKPICPDRAHHAFCRSSYSSKNGLGSVECDFYPPLNTTALGPGEKESICRHRHPHRHPHHSHHHHHHHPPHTGDEGHPPHGHDHGHGQGHPPHGHDRGQGPPPHAHGQGPPPHGHGHGQGPPPHADGQGPPPHGHDHGQGPPPHGHGHGQGPPPGHERWHHRKPFHPCHGFLTNVDPALHPICPWPHPEPRPRPKPSQP